MNASCEDVSEQLRQQLKEKEQRISELESIIRKQKADAEFKASSDVGPLSPRDRLSNSEIGRYSRQLILPEIAVKGQLCLASTAVLVVGAGGLGCPAAIYLAAAGIGRLGVVDYDEVELSNLHRQVLHTEAKVGVTKSTSVTMACRELNSHVDYVPYHTQLDSSNALQIIQNYDIVLDASDNVSTRYLLNDACVLANKPLVSGSALRFEGQLTVYHHDNGPCYRCLFPKPPPPETVTNCSDGGVLGVVPGIMGSLQALEAIKIATQNQSSFSGRMLMFDGLEGTFHKIKLRGRQPTCEVCGDNPTITKLIDYQQFCGARADDKDKSVCLLTPEDRVSVKDYKAVLDSRQNHLLVDVRSHVEMEICKLPTDTINIPISDIDKGKSVEDLQNAITKHNRTKNEDFPVYVVCRRGNDSQVAVKKLQNLLSREKVQIRDIKGGLHAWARSIDLTFPVY